MRKLGRSTGITLIELIVVVGLISLLMTLALAGIQAARESARTTQCANNLRQLGLALNAYESTHQMFPAGNAEDGTGPHFALLPQLDLQSLMAWCEERVAKKPVEEQQSYRVKLIGSKVVPVFSCPSDSSPDVTLRPKIAMQMDGLWKPHTTCNRLGLTRRSQGVVERQKSISIGCLGLSKAQPFMARHKGLRKGALRPALGPAQSMHRPEDGP